MDRYPEFTVCGFGSGQREALEYCGSHSGRDGDKIAHCGLTPVASSRVPAPGFDEAEIIVECRQMYWQDFDPQLFLGDFIEANYPNKDYHRLYLGEVLASGRSCPLPRLTVSRPQRARRGSAVGQLRRLIRCSLRGSGYDSRERPYLCPRDGGCS